MTIGLIGYGRFGKLAAHYLSRYARVVVYDRRSAATAAHGAKIRRAPLAEVASQPVVILAVPISEMPRTLRAIRSHLVAGALVADVCTVKVRPVAWMRGILPKSVSILGAHPLFGPDSVSGTLRGHRVILTPVRISGRFLRRIISRLSRAGIRATTMTPEHHDRMVAETILLTHYVGRVVHDAALRRWANGTRSYGKLQEVVDVALNDTFQLLQDVWSYNPYSRSVAAALRRSERRLSLRLRSGPTRR